MKKYILTPFACLILSAAFSQTGSFTGTWTGKVNVGVELRAVFHFKQNDNGSIKATFDSPDQSAFGLKCDTTIVNGNQITVEMTDLRASFTGRLLNDSTIDGVMKQGVEFPLVLKRTTASLENKHSQEPQPPFPYRSEDVEYDNADKSLHYGATLTLPNGNGPFPAVVLITGSGPQNRNEELMGHKPFLVLSDALTRNGIAVLRVDDRGVGKSTGIFNNATSADFAKDVSTSVDYLLKRSEVDKKKIGLIGHSEGGMIAPIVATSRKDIAFVVLLAGPGIKIDQLMVEQNTAIFRAAGISQKAIDSYIPVYKKLAQALVNATDSAAALKAGTDYLNQWVAGADTAILRELGMEKETDRNNMAKAMAQAYSRTWFKYFLAFDPQPYLQKLTGKVLALNGDKDIQVVAASNLAGIESALKKSKVKSYSVKSLPGLNHLFQNCKTCTLMEYGQLEETFSPTALQEINDWLTKEIK